MTPKLIPDLSRQALQAIAAFLPIFEAPGFRFAEEDSPRFNKDDSRTSVYYDDQVVEMIKTLDRYGWLYNSKDFFWPTWIESAEAMYLQEDPAALAAASPVQLARLMTIIVRRDGEEGRSIFDDWESGLLLGVLRRAAELARKGLN